MKRIELRGENNMVMLIIAFLFSVACSRQEMDRNPYLPELQFSIPVNLNLPEYNALLFAGGSHLIPQYGHKGILVFNLNGSSYMAWEASCPNHAPNDCSRTQVVGVLAECACEGYQYSLATGQLLNPTSEDSSPYSLVFYSTELRGSTLVISN